MSNSNEQENHQQPHPVQGAIGGTPRFIEAIKAMNKLRDAPPQIAAPIIAALDLPERPLGAAPDVPQ